MKGKARVKEIISILLIYIFNCFPVKNNKIFLFSYYGSQYGCNPKSISEYITQHDLEKKYDVVWALNDSQQSKQLRRVRTVKTMSLRYFYELCTSKIVITNFRTTSHYVKRKNQYYIQTWHSSLRLKQIEKDAENSLSKQYIKMAKKDSQKCDLLLSGCKYSTRIFKRSFWYTGEIFEYGTPRNDVLFKNNKQRKDEIIKNLGLNPSKNIILYAPTFRKNNSIGVYDLDFKKIKEKLNKKFGGEWVFLVKLHPHLLDMSNQLIHDNQVKDVTSYDDIQELLLIADVLISDYSSLIFDFSLTGRPCFLYVPDFKEYTSSERQLYFELSELPFITATSNVDLEGKIIEFDEKKYKSNVNEFLDGIGSFEEGLACKKLMERIAAICFEQQRSEMNEAI
ncbi:CDP-glycerol glycerophosphotransferase family protein [Jeotgalibacillus marinus]|uniref:CDP-glycerol glycerophosphotransferase family protein n=1 Tax=Jeotgalibacillus marinus TaxID=86667 RepID=A0ABV3Q152_9BACL